MTDGLEIFGNQCHILNRFRRQSVCLIRVQQTAE